MENIILDTKIQHGKVILHDVPLEDDTPIKVIVIPKTNLQRLSFQKTRILLQDVPGNLADDVRKERGG
ncbi:hypothetical protein TI05_03325 [Achromatium sp. WMS3]|nr:hypothetical protein TI05_03325 [Achromatium sp. WMS3]